VGPFEVIDQAEEFTVAIRRSKLLRTQTHVRRTVVADPGICEVVQFTPEEILIVGKAQGATHVTFLFDNDSPRPATYLVRVTPDPDVQRQRQRQCAGFERNLSGLFPNRNIRVLPASDGETILLYGDARDVRDAARILEATRAMVFAAGPTDGWRAEKVDASVSGQASQTQGEMLAPPQVVNLLRIAKAH